MSKWRQKCSQLQIIELMTSKWRQKCSPLQVIKPLTEKTWGQSCVIFGEQKNKERKGEIPLRTGKYFDTLGYRLVCLFCSYHILTSSVIIFSCCDLLLNRPSATWNLFVNYISYSTCAHIVNESELWALSLIQLSPSFVIPVISTAESSAPKTKKVSSTPAHQSQVIIGSVVGTVTLTLLAGILLVCR